MASCSFLEDPLPSSSNPLTDLPPSQESAEELIVVHMDISSPLLRLRSIIEEKVGQSLVGFRFTLLDSVELNGESSLVEQCMQEKGIVQINCELRIPEKTINIDDVLRPNEDFFYEHHSGGTDEEDEAEGTTEVPSTSTDPADDIMEVPSTSADTPDDIMEVLSTSTDMPDDMIEEPSTLKDVTSPVAVPPSANPGVRIVMERKLMSYKEILPKARIFLGQNKKWTIDKKFLVYQQEFGIPQDPEKWNKYHVRVWLFWAIGQFKMARIDLRQWDLTGVDLLKLSEVDLNARVHRDPKNLFSTHFKLLKKCRVVAVNIDEDNSCLKVNKIPRCSVKRERTCLIPMSRDELVEKRRMRGWQLPPITEEDEAIAIENSSYEATRPLQLWQFLLQLLTTWHHRDAIQWTENEGEFKLMKPEIVAHLWGLIKNRPTMTYRKMSRAIRYYYIDNMISKEGSSDFD